MLDEQFSLFNLAMICAAIGAAMYFNLARGHDSERGVATLTIGGGLHQLGWLVWAGCEFRGNGVGAWLGMLLLVLGQLGLLAGTRRSFARPAVLGWWAALLPLLLLGMLADALQLITATQTPLLQALLLAPLAFQIGRESLLPGNDESWSVPRWMLVGVTFCMAVTLLLSAVLALFGGITLTQLSVIDAILASLVCILLPYNYQLLTAHRLSSRLAKLVRYDALTGLLNRRGLEEYAKRELHRAAKHQTGLGLMLIDIDQFRIINQRYGYGAGDVALRKCAKCLRDIAGEAAFIGRVAGEEFCVILADKTSHQLRSLAVEIEMALQAQMIEHGDVSFHLSVTLSLVKFGRHGNDFESLLQRAEEKLQSRKEHLKVVELPLALPVTVS